MAQQTFEELVAAVKQAESRGKRYAQDGKTLTTSPKGALGEMQVMPKTVTDPGFGVVPAKDKSPDEIARVGRDYLQAMKQRYGDTEKALIAYNWGPGSTDKWIAAGANPEKLPAETKTYIERVKGLLGGKTQVAKTAAEPTPAEEMMTKALPAGTTAKAPDVSRETMLAKMDVKSMPASYQAAFALAALADAQDEEDDRVYNENKGTETEKFFAEHKPVNHLASLDLSVQPVMMAEGGDPKSAKSLMEKFKDLASEYERDPVAFMRERKIPTSPMGQALTAGYETYKHVTGKDPLLDLQKELSQRLSPEIDTGDTESISIEVGLPRIRRAEGSPEEGEEASKPFFGNPNISRQAGQARRNAAIQKASFRDELADAKDTARKGDAYQEMERYLQSRDAVPDIKVTGYLPEETHGLFSSDRTNMGTGTIKVNKNVHETYMPSTIAHEMTHAADRQMMIQAKEQGMFGKSNQFTDAYEKMVGPEGRNRTQLLRKRYPEFEEDNRYYRSRPDEVAAHAIGAYSGPVLQDRAPRHVDATAATEFQILMDLAQRHADQGPKGLEKIPAFFKKMGRYADGGEVGNLTPQQIERIAAQEAADRDAASTAAFIAQKSGIGRKEGNISKALKSGEGQVEMAKGMTMMPQNVLGAPVDIATMAMRPFGYDVEKPVMGSEWLKEKTRNAGLAFKPSDDPTLAGFFEAGNIASGLVNPAGITRSGVQAAEKTGEAAKMLARDFQQYNQNLAVPGASYVRRPAGGVFPTAKNAEEEAVSALDQSIQSTLRNLDYVAVPAENKEAAKQFIDTKLRDYFKTKASSIADPVREALINGKIKIPKDSALEEMFPQALINASRAGDVTAMKEIEKRFDNMVNIGNYRVRKEGQTLDDNEAARQAFNQIILQQMKANPNIIPDEFLLRLAKKNADKLPPAKQAEEIAAIREKLANNPTLFNVVFEPKISRLLDNKTLESISENALATSPQYYPTLINAPKRQEGIMALQADVPITDLQSRHGLPHMFNVSASDLVDELTKINPKDLAQMSVPEFYAKAIPSVAKANEFNKKVETVEALATANKPVPAELGQYGTKEFLPTDQQGMTWREITDPEATKIQAKFLGNSIAGYSRAGTYGPLDNGITALKNGEVRLFSLYDKNGHAVNNVEFVTPDVATKNPKYGNKANTITQMYGNGVKTGNVTPENYPAQMLDLVNALQPKSIPPSIKELFYNNGLTISPPPEPLNAARTIQMNLFQPPAQRALGGMIERQHSDNRRYL